MTTPPIVPATSTSTIKPIIHNLLLPAPHLESIRDINASLNQILDQFPESIPMSPTTDDEASTKQQQQIVPVPGTNGQHQLYPLPVLYYVTVLGDPDLLLRFLEKWEPDLRFYPVAVADEVGASLQKQHGEALESVASSAAAADSSSPLPPSILFTAAQLNLSSCFSVLIKYAKKHETKESMKLLLNQVSPENGCSLLCEAVIAGNVEMCKLLLHEGLDATVLNRPSIYGTPLYIACCLNCTDVIRALLEMYADTIDLEYKHGENGFFDPSECPLVDAIPEYESALMAAARKGNLEGVKLLIQHGAKMDSETQSGRTPLYIAAQNGQYEVVEELLRHDVGIDITLRNMDGTEGETILGAVCKQGYSKICRILLNTGRIDLNRADGNGMTPLHYAVSLRHSECEKELLLNGALRHHSADAIVVDPKKISLSPTQNLFNLVSHSMSQHKIALFVEDSKANHHKAGLVKSSLEEIGFQVSHIHDFAFHSIRANMETIFTQVRELQRAALRFSEQNSPSSPVDEGKPQSFVLLVYCYGEIISQSNNVVSSPSVQSDGNPLDKVHRIIELTAAAMKGCMSTHLFFLDSCDCAHIDSGAVVSADRSLLCCSDPMDAVSFPETNQASRDDSYREVKEEPELKQEKFAPHPFTDVFCQQLTVANISMGQLLDHVQQVCKGYSINWSHSPNLQLDELVLHNHALQNVDLLPESPLPLSEIYALQESPSNSRRRRDRQYDGESKPLARRLRSLSNSLRKAVLDGSKPEPPAQRGKSSKKKSGLLFGIGMLLAGGVFTASLSYVGYRIYCSQRSQRNETSRALDSSQLIG